MNDAKIAYEKLALKALADAANSSALSVHVSKFHQAIVKPYCVKTGQKQLTWKESDWKSLSDFINYLSDKHYISVEGGRIVKLISSDYHEGKENLLNANLGENYGSSPKRRRMETDRELADITNKNKRSASFNSNISTKVDPPPSPRMRKASTSTSNIVYIDVEDNAEDNLDFSSWFKQQSQKQIPTQPQPPILSPSTTTNPLSPQPPQLTSNSTNLSLASQLQTPTPTAPPTPLQQVTVVVPPPPPPPSQQPNCAVCPVCNKALPGMSEIQIGHHIDECLTRDFLAGDSEANQLLEKSPPPVTTASTIPEKPHQRPATISGFSLGNSSGGNRGAEDEDVGLTFYCPYPRCPIPHASLSALEFGKHVASTHQFDPNQNIFCPICKLIGEEPYNTHKLNLWKHLTSIHLDIMGGIITSSDAPPPQLAFSTTNTSSPSKSRTSTTSSATVPPLFPSNSPSSPLNTTNSFPTFIAPAPQVVTLPATPTPAPPFSLFSSSTSPMTNTPFGPIPTASISPIKTTTDTTTTTTTTTANKNNQLVDDLYGFASAFSNNSNAAGKANFSLLSSPTNSNTNTNNKNDASTTTPFFTFGNIFNNNSSSNNNKPTNPFTATTIPTTPAANKSTENPPPLFKPFPPPPPPTTTPFFSTFQPSVATSTSPTPAPAPAATFKPPPPPPPPITTTTASHSPQKQTHHHSLNRRHHSLSHHSHSHSHNRNYDDEENEDNFYNSYRNRNSYNYNNNNNNNSDEDDEENDEDDENDLVDRKMGAFSQKLGLKRRIIKPHKSGSSSSNYHTSTTHPHNNNTTTSSSKPPPPPFFSSTTHRHSTTTSSSNPFQAVASLYIDYELINDLQEEECTICFELFLKGQRLARMECMCVFHKPCLDRWFEKKQYCPLHSKE